MANTRARTISATVCVTRAGSRWVAFGLGERRCERAGYGVGDVGDRTRDCQPRLAGPQLHTRCKALPTTGVNIAAAEQQRTVSQTRVRECCIAAIAA